MTLINVEPELRNWKRRGTKVGDWLTWKKIRSTSSKEVLSRALA